MFAKYCTLMIISDQVILKNKKSSEIMATKHFAQNISNKQWIREPFTDNDLVAGSY